MTSAGEPSRESGGAAVRCPTCGNDNPADAAYCGVCYEVLKKAAVPAAPAEGSAPAFPVPCPSAPLFHPWAAAASFLGAAYFGWRFPDYLPITDGWMSVVRGFPLGSANFLFHEGGHVVFMVFGSQFLTALGGSAFQLALPIACGANFYRQGALLSVLFCVAWLGQNMIDVAFYVADAKQQVLILISGTSGSEGSFHDWACVLDVLGLRDHAVGLGRLLFFAGCWLGLWGPFEAAARLTERFRSARG